MITSDQVRDEVSRLLADKLNAQTIYMELCPKDFIRPGYWIETVREETEHVNFCTVKKRIYFSVTCLFPDGDASPSNMQTAVTELFRQGYLRIGDRALKVSVNAAGHECDRSFVALKFEFFDDLTDAEDNTPLMGDVDVVLKKGD